MESGDFGGIQSFTVVFSLTAGRGGGSEDMTFVW